MSKRALFISKAALGLLMSAAIVAPCGAAIAATNGSQNTSPSISAVTSSSKEEIEIGTFFDAGNGSWIIDYGTDDFDRPTDEKYLWGQVRGVSKSSFEFIDNTNETFFLFMPDGGGSITFTYGFSSSDREIIAQDKGIQGTSRTCDFSFLDSEGNVVSFNAKGTFKSSGDLFLLSQTQTTQLLDVFSKGGEAIMRVEDSSGDYALIPIDCTPLPDAIALTFPDRESTPNTTAIPSNR